MHKKKRVMPEGTTEFREETYFESYPEGLRTPAASAISWPVSNERRPG